jgi:NTE family protein
VKGITYGGSAAALESAGLLANIVGFSGSSAGSQAAALLAAGYSGSELTHQLINTDFNSLLDRTSWNPLEEVQGLVDNYGFFKGEALQAQIDALLALKTGKANTTFLELYKHSGKELKVTATCVTTQRLVWFDKDSSPDMPVSVAVRASSSIPFFYRPVEYQGNLYVDGGCIRNLPHDAFPQGSGSILALSLRGSVGEGPVSISNLMEFSSNLAETILFGPSTANALVVADDNEELDLVEIDYGDVGTVDFALEMHKKVWLVENGFHNVNDRLKQCNHPAAASDIPEWLKDLKVEAEIKREEDRQKQPPTVPEYAKHLEGVKNSVSAFAEEFKVCMDAQEEDGDKPLVSKCLKRGFDDGGWWYHVKRLLQLILSDKRFLFGAVVLLIVIGGVLGLAVVGGAVVRKKRRDRKLAEVSKEAAKTD